MPQTSKQQLSLLRLECFKRAPVLAHGGLYTSLLTARACGRLESTLSAALATAGLAVGAVRLAAAVTLEAVAARMRHTVRAGPEDGPAIFATTRGMA